MKFEGKYEIAHVDCILQNIDDILRKCHNYDIKARPRDRPLVTEHWIESMNSGEYTFITLPCKEYGCMTDFCRPVNKKIFVRKYGAFHFKYSMEQDKIYINSPIDDE